MIGLSFKASLKKRVVGTLLILVVTILLGLLISVRVFISKAPSTQFLVNNTWCSISPWVVKWMVDENESFAQQTVIIGDGYREKIMEAGNWYLITAQNGTVKVKIIWHETQKREEMEQYFNVTTNGTNLLRIYGDLYGYGEEGNYIFYRCDDPR